MTNTVRTQAELLAIYADNTSGDISAQDGRDLIMSSVDGSTATLMIAAGTLDISSAIATSSHYIIVRGEGSAGDDLVEITNGLDPIPDGYQIFLESHNGDDVVITIRQNFGGNTIFVNRDIIQVSLNNLEGQISAVWSEQIGAWLVYNSVTNFISDSVGTTEVDCNENGQIAMFISGLQIAKLYRLANETFFQVLGDFFIAPNGFSNGGKIVLTAINTPSDPEVTTAYLYLKSVGGTEELFLKRSNGSETQLS